MQEMNPDPVFDKLGRFTPVRPDVAEILFAAGRASARTHWLWKTAVAVLVAVNAVAVMLLVSREPRVENHTSPEIPAVIPPAVTSPAEPISPPLSEDPWSYRSLTQIGDPDQFPEPKADAGPPQQVRPLTVQTLLRGELD